MIGRFLCWWGAHARPKHIDKNGGWFWCCTRCSQLCSDDPRAK